ncbi:kazrin-A-like [Clupea harengus]|uniref:Kazrin-A-like n=1 Tax=Clupea harengus TaxID=7950 RepID=A0A6P8FCJ9_CLUHA|nr:kazrin-A-like [Clupea harengus]
MMEDNNQLAGRIDAAVQSASQEVTNLRSELTATSRRLAQLGATETAATPPPDNSPTHTIHDSLSHVCQKPVTDLCYRSDISSFMDFGSPDASLDKGKDPSRHHGNPPWQPPTIHLTQVSVSLSGSVSMVLRFDTFVSIYVFHEDIQSGASRRILEA